MENLKNFIKENNKIEKCFFNGLYENTIEKKYQYIKNHFQYDIMNSWNDLKSFANNVKIYKMGLTDEQQNRFFEINEIDPDYVWLSIEWLINDFQDLTNTNIYFNGRSAGYIVIVPKSEKNEHLLNYYGLEDILYFDNYKEFKQNMNYPYHCNYTSWKNEIEDVYFILKAFDKLCDVLRDELIYILDNYTIEEHEETYTKTVKEIIL